MKQLLLLLVLSMLCLLSSCTETIPPKEETPKAKGIYECFIDGEEFLAKGHNSANQFSPNPHASYTELGGSFRFRISNQETEQDLYIVCLDEMLKEGRYLLSEYTELNGNNKDECDDYFLAIDKKYFIEISHLDKEYDIIVGTYEFDLIDECGLDVMSVSGSFDMEYRL